MNFDKKVILFGAGQLGEKALKLIGKENVAFYADNSPDKQGTKVNDIAVISFNEMVRIHNDYLIVLSVDVHILNKLSEQLEESGIHEYTTYLKLAAELKNEQKLNSEDVLSRVSKAVEWIHNHTVSDKGIYTTSDNCNPYPEVTGYYIPTLMKWGMRDTALQFAKWLCGIQKPDGSWYDTDDTYPYVFDSAQILKGLIAIREIYPQADEKIIRGCNWIILQADANGRLPKPVYADWGADGTCSELIHMYCLSPIIEAGKIFDKPEYISFARKTIQYYMDNCRNEILDFGFLSHFYAYVMEALVDIAETDTAKEAMKKIAEIQRNDGAIPAYKNVNWICSTGMLQLAVVWYKLGDVEHGNKAFNYAIKLQNKSGGWYGSYAVSDNPQNDYDKEYPAYFTSSEISWAVKYFLDAVYYKSKAEYELQADNFKDQISVTDGRYKFILENINKPNYKSILDIGCGKGRYIKNLLLDTNDKKFYAVDISENVMKKIPREVECKTGILTCIPYPDEYFDAVYAVESLEHSILAENAVKEMLRTVKHDGIVIVIDKNKSAMGMLETEEWEQWFDDDFFEKIAEDNNCELTVTHNIPYDNCSNNLFSGWILKKRGDVIEKSHADFWDTP